MSSLKYMPSAVFSGLAGEGRMNALVGERNGVGGQEGGASEKQNFFFLVNEECSQNLRWETVLLRQQTTKHFLKAGILFPQSSK